jgi:hypothetical protein
MLGIWRSAGSWHPFDRLSSGGYRRDAHQTREGNYVQDMYINSGDMPIYIHSIVNCLGGHRACYRFLQREGHRAEHRSAGAERGEIDVQILG